MGLSHSHNDAHGRSRVVWDGPAPNAIGAPSGPGRGMTDLWVYHSSPAPLSGERDDGDLPHSFEPPPNGGHLRIVQSRGRQPGYDPALDPHAVPRHEPRRRPPIPICRKHAPSISAWCSTVRARWSWTPRKYTSSQGTPSSNGARTTPGAIVRPVPAPLPSRPTTEPTSRP